MALGAPRAVRVRARVDPRPDVSRFAPLRAAQRHEPAGRRAFVNRRYSAESESLPSDTAESFKPGVFHRLWKSLNRVMPVACGKQMLRRLYQAFPPYTTAARTTAARSDLRTEETSSTGTDDSTTISPERGRYNRVVARFRVGAGSNLALLRAYAAALTLGAVALTATLIALRTPIGSPVALGVLCVIAVYAESQTIRLTPALEASASIVFVVAAVLFGPLAAIVVGATGLLVDLPRRDDDHPILRWLIWTSTRVLVAGAAGGAAWLITRHANSTLSVLLLAVTAAALADVVGDVILTPVPAVLRGRRWLDVTRALVPAELAALPLHVLVISVLAYAYHHISPWSVVLFVVPALAAQRLWLLYRQQRETAEELVSVNARLATANLSFATALVATLDARDRYTAGHSAAVAIYARDIAARMGLDERDQQRAHLCGLVHDIGKVGLPPGLLEKPGALTLEERRQMENHATIGERILKNVADYAEIASVVRHHHERFDGGGYPDRLSAEEIPLLSRIIAVADAYNAMTSDRPYRDAMPSRVARLRLAQAVETQFDTSVVAAFEAILAAADEAYRLGKGSEFTLGVQEDRVAGLNVAA